MNSKQQTEYDEAVKQILLERTSYGFSDSGERVLKTDPKCLVENNTKEYHNYHTTITDLEISQLPPPPQEWLETEYCEECKEDQPADTFKESEKWCSDVCESCWEKEQPIFIPPPPQFADKTELEEFYIEREHYEKREKLRKIKTTQERFNLRSSGATEKEIHKWGQKHRRNTNARFNRFYDKWEDQIWKDNRIKRDKRLREEADKQFMEENA